MNVHGALLCVYQMVYMFQIVLVSATSPGTYTTTAQPETNSRGHVVKHASTKALATRSRFFMRGLKNVVLVGSYPSETADDIFWPTVEVAVHRNRKCYALRVPYDPDMSVLTAVISAARRVGMTTKRKHNPFDLGLIWNSARRCYIVLRAARINNSHKKSWVVVVNDSADKIIYHSQCLPGYNKLILRPGNKVEFYYV